MCTSAENCLKKLNNKKIIGEISQHVFVTLPLNAQKKMLLKIPFKNTTLKLNKALWRYTIVVIEEMDD